MNITFLIIQTLVFATPIMLTAMGGLYSERSGVVNIGLEGFMLIGAFVGASVQRILEVNYGFGLSSTWLGLLAAMIVCGLASLIHAFLSINIKANQVVSGTAINIIAAGITVFFSEIIFDNKRTPAFNTAYNIKKINISALSDLPVVGFLFKNNIYYTTILVFIIIIISYILLYKTPFGLRFRSVGEHPSAADSLGINVYKMRYFGVVVSGMLSGLSGAIVLFTQDTQFHLGVIHGLGFIALATLIFGQWKPLGVVLASMLFSFLQSLSVLLSRVNIPYELLSTLPYIFTIVSLIIFSRNSVEPAAIGIPYEKGKR